MNASSRSTNRILLLILSGILLATVGTQYDGFVGGLLQGAGVALVIGGAWSFGALWRHGHDSDHTWLPSKDRDRGDR